MMGIGLKAMSHENNRDDMGTPLLVDRCQAGNTLLPQKSCQTGRCHARHLLLWRTECSRSRSELFEVAKVSAVFGHWSPQDNPAMPVCLG